MRNMNFERTDFVSIPVHDVLGMDSPDWDAG